MKILIAVPTFEHIEAEVFKSIYDLDTCGHQTSFESVKGYDTATARNLIALKAQEHNYDYVLMVDSDTKIPRSTLRYLLDPQEDIVLGFCPVKNTKTQESAMMPINGEYRHIKYSELQDKRIEVARGGMACALIRTNVFRRMRPPYFEFAIMPNGLVGSEGYNFCDKASKLGYRIWADARVRCGHLARYYQYE